MKIALDLGHGCPPDTGASGILAEEDAIKAVAEHLIPLLESKHEVILVRPKSATSVMGSLQKRVLAANKANADLYLSIHFNAFDETAKGTEVFAASPEGKTYAASVLQEICKLGFADRKVKNGSHLYVVKNSNMPAILVECCFCDNKTDCTLFDPLKMAQAIANGIG